MANHQCLRCRSALIQATRNRQSLTTCRRRPYSSTPTSATEPLTSTVDNDPPTPPSETAPLKPLLDIAALLSKPSWSVRSLLPPTTTASSTTSTTAITSPPTTSPLAPTITPSLLSHLLRLSALPQPRSVAEEASLISTLETQLHFVRAIQAVDTTGVEPLVTIRDETAEGLAEITIGMQDAGVREVLGQERGVGRMGRVRRVRKGVSVRDGGEERSGEGRLEGNGGVEDRRSAEERQWDPLSGTQGKTVGRYFVVESGKGGGSGSGAEKEASGEKGAGESATTVD